MQLHDEIASISYQSLRWQLRGISQNQACRWQRVSTNPPGFELERWYSPGHLWWEGSRENRHYTMARSILRALISLANITDWILSQIHMDKHTASIVSAALSVDIHMNPNQLSTVTHPLNTHDYAATDQQMSTKADYPDSHRNIEQPPHPTEVNWDPW